MPGTILGSKEERREREDKVMRDIFDRNQKKGTFVSETPSGFSKDKSTFRGEDIAVKRGK